MAKGVSKSPAKSTRVLRSKKAKATAAKAKPIKPGSSNRYHSAALALKVNDLGDESSDDEALEDDKTRYIPGLSASRFLKNEFATASALKAEDPEDGAAVDDKTPYVPDLSTLPFLKSEYATEIGTGSGSGNTQDEPSGECLSASTSIPDLCTRFCTQLNLPPKFAHASSHLATTSTTIPDLADRPFLSTVAACIYMASALLSQPQTAKDISHITRISDGSIRLSYAYLYLHRARLVAPNWLAANAAALPAALAIRADSQSRASPTTTASDICVRICYQLGLKHLRFYDVASHIADRACAISASSSSSSSSIWTHETRAPPAVAAAAVLMSAALMGCPKAIADVAAVAGVAEATVRGAYGVLYRVRESVVEREWIEKGWGSMGNLPVVEDSVVSVGEGRGRKVGKGKGKKRPNIPVGKEEFGRAVSGFTGQ